MPTIAAKKLEYEERLMGYLTKYSKVVFAGVKNVRSQELHKVRADLRGNAEFLMGKKTLQAKVLEKRALASDDASEEKKFHEECKKNNILSGLSGLIFTNEDLQEITSVLDKYRTKTPARVGAISPCDVVVPAGNTGMEPTQTAFFQALNIATKISKGTVEIISDRKVLSTGDRVDNSTATLLQKLNISPFYYQVEVLHVWDRGVLFSCDDLKITDDMLEGYLLEGISNVSAMSLGAGIPTASTIGSMLVDAFKTLLGASVATDYEFDEYNGKELREAAIKGTLAGAGPADTVEDAPAAAASGAAAADAAPEPEEDEEDDFGMGCLF